MEDEFNQNITDLVISMSDILVYIVDVKQFATIEQLINAIGEANGLIGRALELFNKHKEHGTLGECYPIDYIR